MSLFVLQQIRAPPQDRFTVPSIFFSQTVSRLMGGTPTAGRRRSTPEDKSYNGSRRTHSRALLSTVSVVLVCSGSWLIAEAVGAAAAAQSTEKAPIPTYEQTHEQTTAAQMRELGKRQYRQGNYDASRKAFMGETVRVKPLHPCSRTRLRVVLNIPRCVCSAFAHYPCGAYSCRRCGSLRCPQPRLPRKFFVSHGVS